MLVTQPWSGITPAISSEQVNPIKVNVVSILGELKKSKSFTPDISNLKTKSTKVSLGLLAIFLAVRLCCSLGVSWPFRCECKCLSAGVHVPNFICVPTFHSQVTCITCNYKSNTVEPFWDLSLEFPERYHSIEKGIIPVNQTECMLTEMLAKFTETEALEGRIYACDQCNSKSAAVSAD